MPISCRGAVWVFSLVSRMLPHVINQVESRVSLKKEFVFILYHTQVRSNLYIARRPVEQTLINDCSIQVKLPLWNLEVHS